jgi:transposase
VALKVEKAKYTEEFKTEVIKYALEHPEESARKVMKKFGINESAYYKWKKQYGTDGKVTSRGSGNYASEEAKELAKLKKENRDLKDALEVLKKAIGIVGR